MSAFKAPIRFFLGSNTPEGFVGTTETLYTPDGWRVYILKGGPGTGKSTLMRHVYEQLTAVNETGEVFCCSSDPHSLDAVRFPDRRLCVIDGTSPHRIETSYWGAVEQIVPLSLCMGDLGNNTRSVVQLTDKKCVLHRRCCAQLRAAAVLLNDSRRIENDCLDREKVCRYARRLSTSEYISKKGETQPSASEIRFLSAFTPDGWITLYDTLQALCPRIYAIEDEQGAAAGLLLSELEKAANANGNPCIACPCPLFPNDGPEHLILPELGLAFTTSNSFHKVDFPVLRRIHASRFLDAERMRRHRQRLCFLRRAATELLREATLLSAQAKAVHDQLEQYTAAVMDWQRYEDLTNELLQNI